jgi:hypothetical protein
MAEALASLKEGLRDTADPLYDSWKLRPRPSTSAGGEAPQPEGAPRINRLAPGPVTEVEIDITLDGTPDQTPAVVPGPATAMEGDEMIDVSLEEAFFNEAGRVESTEASTETTPDPPIRSSVQADTVRVRVISYQPFPQWAVVVAAALLVFAASLFALRLGLPFGATRSAGALLAGETMLKNEAVTLVPPVPPLPIPDPAASGAAPFAAPAVSAAGASAPDFSWQSGAESEFVDPPTPHPAAAPVPPPSPAAKIPDAPSRRRRGARDFFRDPGF